MTIAEAGAALMSGLSLEPIRVLHVTSVEADNYYLNHLIAHSADTGIEYSALTLANDAGFGEGVRRHGGTAYSLGCTARRQYPKAMQDIERIARADGIHILHAHLFEPTLVCLGVVRRLGLPLVVTRHHSDALYRLKNPLKRSAYLALEQWINNSADHIIAPSTVVRDILLEREGVPRGKVSLIPYGQSASRAAEAARIDRAAKRREFQMGDGPALVCVSRLVEQKGHRYLFEAFRDIVACGSEARLYLVGAGPERRRLEQLSVRLGIGERVRFLGWRDDALSIVSAAEVLVHPSLEDALPSAVIEACLLEKPVVASNVSGVRDILAGGSAGRVVPMADAAALRDALMATLSDLPRAREMARAAQAHVLTYMDALRVAREYAACYRDVLSGPGTTA